MGVRWVGEGRVSRLDYAAEHGRPAERLIPNVDHAHKSQMIKLPSGAGAVFAGSPVSEIPARLMTS